MPMQKLGVVDALQNQFSVSVDAEKLKPEDALYQLPSQLQSFHHDQALLSSQPLYASSVVVLHVEHTFEPAKW